MGRPRAEGCSLQNPFSIDAPAQGGLLLLLLMTLPLMLLSETLWCLLCVHIECSLSDHTTNETLFSPEKDFIMYLPASHATGKSYRNNAAVVLKLHCMQW